MAVGTCVCIGSVGNTLLNTHSLDIKLHLLLDTYRTTFIHSLNFSVETRGIVLIFWRASAFHFNQRITTGCLCGCFIFFFPPPLSFPKFGWTMAMARCYFSIALCVMQARIAYCGWACSSASGWLDYKDAGGELYPFSFFLSFLLLTPFQF